MAHSLSGDQLSRIAMSPNLAHGIWIGFPAECFESGIINAYHAG